MKRAPGWHSDALRSSNPLPYALLLWAGALSGLGRGLAWPLALCGLLLMFYRVVRAPTLRTAMLSGVSFGVGEAGVCFLGSYSWGVNVPLSLTLLGVTLHHLPLSIWASRAPSFLRAPWLWVATIGLSTSLASFVELIGLPNREATVVVSALPQLVGGARLFGSDLITGLVETGIFAAALALAKRSGDQPWGAVLGQGLRPLLVTVLGLAAASVAARATASPDHDTIAVGIPQINADSSYYKSRLVAPSVARAFDHDFELLSEKLSRAELVVTTESFDGRFGLMLPSVRDAWAARAKRRGQAWLATSYIVKSDGRKANAAGAFTADGRLAGVHEKVDLAPFGERDLAPGDTYHPLAIAPGVELGVMICQESFLRRGSLSLARAGANLLAATTSDVTFGSSTTVFEHIAMTQLRAIESGRSIIWASNAGPSGVIDNQGRFHHGPFRVRAGVEVTASLHSELTPFHRYVTFWLLLGPALLAIALITAGHATPGALPPAAEVTTPTPTRVLLRYATALAVLLLAATTAIGASAAVQARWDRPARALSAITETFTESPTVGEPEPYRRFARSPGRSAEGAIAYLLEYYGLDRDDSQLLSSLPPAPSMEIVGQFLKEHYGLASRRVRLTGELPLTPMLLRAPDGNFAVVDYAGSGHGALVDFATGTATFISSVELARLIDVDALFPYGER